MSYTFKGKKFENRNHLAYYIWCNDNSVSYDEKSLKSLSAKEIQRALKFVYHRYGRSGLKKYKDKTGKDFKRKIIEVENNPNLDKYKHKNVKLHFKCVTCGKDVFTAYSTYIRFKDNLCKNCRKSMKDKQES